MNQSALTIEYIDAAVARATDPNVRLDTLRSDCAFLERVAESAAQVATDGGPAMQVAVAKLASTRAVIGSITVPSVFGADVAAAFGRLAEGPATADAVAACETALKNTVVHAHQVVADFAAVEADLLKVAALRAYLDAYTRLLEQLAS